MGVPKCKECDLMAAELMDCGRNQFWCLHPESKTECLPHNIITRSREKEIPIKTSPKWCPKRKETRS